MKKFISLVAGNILSKALAIVREVLFAAWFGTSETAAAYRIAQTGMLLPVHALVGDSLGAGLIPLYKRLRSTSADQARLLLLLACLYGLALAALISGLLYTFAELSVTAIAPGANTKALTVASDLLKVMAFATPFYVVSGILSFIEAGHGRVGAVAWRPSLLNIGAIAGGALAVFTGHAHWLATTLLMTYVTFFLITIVRFLSLDRLTPEHQETYASLRPVAAHFFKNSLPLMALPFIGQASILAERAASSWLGTEVIPSVDYARFISDTVVQLIAVPLGILTMSRHGGGTTSDFRDHVLKTTAGILAISVPVGIFIATHADDIVTLLFARGAFDAHSVELTSTILVWAAAGLGATVAAYYLVKALNAELRNVDALLFTTIASAVSITLNVTCWSALGPKVLGISITAYGVTLFVLCATRLKLWTPLAPLLAGLAGIAALQLADLWLGPRFETPLAEVLFDGLLTSAIWLLAVRFIAPIRRAAAPVLGKIPVAGIFFR